MSGSVPATMSLRGDVLPVHLTEWQLPPDWRWGSEGLYGDHRHYQQVIDALGRSLSLVSAPNPSHLAWLRSEAQHLAHRSHPSIPTTYHYWTADSAIRRGPGYLRRWITGETVRKRVNRMGEADIPFVLQTLRGTCSTLAYLHDSGTAHGGVGPDTVWISPGGRLWLLEWQWSVPMADIPKGIVPSWLFPASATEQLPGRRLIGPGIPIAPEWSFGAEWRPTSESDQWQVAAMCFTALIGEPPPAEVPPLKLLRPEVPAGLAEALDRALLRDPSERFPSMMAFLRTADAGYLSRSLFVLPSEDVGESAHVSEEKKLRWALGDEYELLSRLGSGSFGVVWRARDLALEREVAVKILHPHVARNDEAVAAFRREAKLAAQLAHPAIVPIYQWDSRGELSWYIMELEEAGSLNDLVTNSGPRSLQEVAPQIELLLDGLAAAHSVGIIHRDLKPENILIDRYHRWRLTDFGIANVSGMDRANAEGTPAFAAPEQLLGEPQSSQTDLFALGAIVYFALTGLPPFGSGDVKSILGAALSRNYDQSELPRAIADWLRYALEPDLDKRFSDAIEMKREWVKAVAKARSPLEPSRFWRKIFGQRE
jgi:serine/threonine protein kinase